MKEKLLMDIHLLKEIDGEDPIKADGKMLVIDGGFSKAYQKRQVLRVIHYFTIHLACN